MASSIPPAPQRKRLFETARCELAQGGRTVAAAVRAHPKRLVLTLGVALMGTAITTYAIAPDSPDPALMPKVIVSVPLATDAAQQAQSLDDQPLMLYNSAQVRGTDTVQTLLRRLGVTDPGTLRTLSREGYMRSLVDANAGAEVSAEVDSTGQLHTLRGDLAVHEVRARNTSPASSKERQDGQADGAGQWHRLTVTATPTGWQTSLTPLVPQIRTALAGGEIQSSLQKSAQLAALPASVLAQMEHIFADRVNLRRSMRRGDHFAVVYELLTVDGRPVGAGRVLAAQITAGGKPLSALWFAPRGRSTHGSYYTPDGHSLNPEFLAFPVPFRGVTSRFGMRFDPVVKRTQLHEGVDLHAAVGTPVHTIADGRVIMAGVDGGYGNVVKIDHPGGYETVYAHLSKIVVTRGQHVRAGQVIAKSGNSGWSTGPHLHFEFHVRGRVVDPLKMAQYVPASRPLPAEERAGFLAATAVLNTQLAQAEGGASRLASADTTSETD